jgi:hypothetical protein
MDTISPLPSPVLCPHAPEWFVTTAKGAVAAGLRIEFNVDPSLTGLVIGKKVSVGAFVRFLSRRSTCPSVPDQA